MAEYLAKYELNLDKKPNRLLHLDDIYKEHKFLLNSDDNPIILAKEYLAMNLGIEYVLKDLYKLEKISLNEEKNLKIINNRSLEKLVS